jgi:predicted DCC family thiol-disulfide oxidoreductase YuxK
MHCVSQRRLLLYLCEMGITSDSGQAPKGWILYDSACGICTHLALKAAPFLVQIGLHVIPLQSPWAQAVIGQTGDPLLSDIRLVHPNGSIVSGPDVYRYVMKNVWWAYPLYQLSLVPGFKSAFDWGYRAFARNRMRISNACAIPSAPVNDGSPHG